MPRARAHPAVSEADKARLRVMLAGADPVALLAEIRAAQAELGGRVDRRGLDADPLADIRNTRRIRAVWQRGREIAGPVACERMSEKDRARPVR